MWENLQKRRENKWKPKPSPTSSLVTTGVGIATSVAGLGTLCEKYRINKVRISVWSERWYDRDGLCYIKTWSFTVFKMGWRARQIRSTFLSADLLKASDVGLNDMITQFSECVSNSQFVIIIIKFLLKGRDGKDRNWGMIPGFGCKVVINFGQYKVNV